MFLLCFVIFVTLFTSSSASPGMSITPFSEVQPRLCGLHAAVLNFLHLETTVSAGIWGDLVLIRHFQQLHAALLFDHPKGGNTHVCFRDLCSRANRVIQPKEEMSLLVKQAHRILSLITEIHVIPSHLLIYLQIMFCPHPPAPCTNLSAPHSSPALALWCPHFQFTFLPSSPAPGHPDSPVLPPLSAPRKASGGLSSLYKYIPCHILLAANDGIVPCHHQKSDERSIYVQ